MARIERATSPLPRECSTTEPHGQYKPLTPAPLPPIAGAGEGNRTLVISLEGFCSTIELHPRLPLQETRSRFHSPLQLSRRPQKDFARRHALLVEGEGFEPSKAEPSDLQSDPVDRLGIPPRESPAL